MSGEGNPNHDPSTGQFSSGGGSSGPKSKVGKTPRKLRTAKRSTQPSAPAKGGVHATMNDAAIKTLMAQPPIHGKEAAHNAMKVLGVTPAPDLEAYAKTGRKARTANRTEGEPTAAGSGGQGRHSAADVEKFKAIDAAHKPSQAIVDDQRAQRRTVAKAGLPRAGYASRQYLAQMANASDARNASGSDPKPVGRAARTAARANLADPARGYSGDSPTGTPANPGKMKTLHQLQDEMKVEKDAAATVAKHGFQKFAAYNAQGVEDGHGGIAQTKFIHPETGHKVTVHSNGKWHFSNAAIAGGSKSGVGPESLNEYLSKKLRK